MSNRTEDSSSDSFYAVTPSDTLSIRGLPIATDKETCRYLIVGVAGNIAAINRAGATHIVPVQAGHVSLRTSRIMATNTSATGIVACD